MCPPDECKSNSSGAPLSSDLVSTNVPLFPPANFFTVSICLFPADYIVYSWFDGSDGTELYSKCAVRPKLGAKRAENFVIIWWLTPLFDPLVIKH